MHLCCRPPAALQFITQHTHMQLVTLTSCNVLIQYTCSATQRNLQPDLVAPRFQLVGLALPSWVDQLALLSLTLPWLQLRAVRRCPLPVLVRVHHWQASRFLSHT